MRIASIEIKNLAAFSDFSRELPPVTILEGPHAAGKTSVERVIMYALGRRPLADKGSRAVQHDPGILHGKSDTGYVIVKFSEDSPAEFLRCMVKSDGTTRQVKMRGSKKWEDAGEFIDDVTNALAYDPMKLRDLNEKDRLEAFLRVVPVEIGQQEFSAAVGGVIPADTTKKLGLESINTAYDEIYSARTTENANADRLKKHATELEATLPPEDAQGGDAETQLWKLKNQLEVLKVDANNRGSAAVDDFREFENAARETATAASRAIDADIDTKIRALESERVERQSMVLAKQNEGVRVMREATDKKREEILAEVRPKIEELNGQIGTLEERLRSSVVIATTRKNAASAKEGAALHTAKSAEMTNALDRLHKLKATVGGRMKMPGVTIAAPRPGAPVDICREESGALIPFSRWNDYSKDQFCMRLAVLGHGLFGLVCVDNLANFSLARKKAIIETACGYAKTEGLQFIFGVANDGTELKVIDASEVVFG